MRHKVNIKIALLLTCMFLSAFGAKISAQSSTVYTIKGVVTDEFGKPLSGVVVNSETGKNGTSTDIEGSYMLTVDDGSKDIVFSYLGYKDKKVAIAEKETIDAKLEPDALKSDEIIDMGFVQQRRGAISGAVSSVKGTPIEAAPVSSFGAAMNGFVTNLMVRQNNYVLGNETVSMLIRGASNPQNGWQTPLIMIDGVMSSYNSNDVLRYLTAKEVESITLLKDASTQALYGVKGNAGVLVITTKRGKKGTVRIDVSYDQSVQQPTISPRFYHSWEYATFKNEATYNDNPSLGKTPVYSPVDIANYISGENRELYPDNNWRDMFYKKLTTMSRANINVTGGSDKFTYFTQVNFMHQGGQFKTTNERYKSGFNTNWFNYRTNVDIKVNKYLSSYLRLSGNVRRDRAPGSDAFYNAQQGLYEDMYWRGANIYGPLTPAVYDQATGEMLDPGGKLVVEEKNTYSIYGVLNRMGYNKATSVNINSQFGLDLDLSFVTKGLKLGGYIAYQTYGYNSLTAIQSNELVKRKTTDDPSVLAFETIGTTKDSELSYGKGYSSYYHLDYRAYLDYQRTFGKHNVQATAFIYYQNLSKADMGSSNNVLPFNTVLSGVEAAYGYDNRYFVKVDLGYSATEQFAPDRRWIATPAISGAWNLANEHFMKNVKWLNEFKIRASYGRTAEDDLQNGRHGYLDENQFGTGGSVPVLAYSTWENKKGYALLQAQTMLKQNYGIDVGLFNGFTFSFDYFKERMDNMLIHATSTIPSYQGIPINNYPATQVGVYENKGYDLSANYYKRINADWSFNVGGWVSYARNKVIYKDETELGESYSYRRKEEGFPLGTSFGLMVDYSNGNGYFNSQEEIDRYECTYGWNMPSPRVGDLIFKDINGDYIIDEKDQVPFGYGGIPQVFYAFNGGFKYKNLEFSFLFQGVARTGGFESSTWHLNYEGIYTRLHEGAWTPERYAAGKEITAPALSNSQTSSDMRNNSYNWNDRAFLRLKNVEIAYTLPLNVSKKISADKIRFSLSGQNLVTWGRMKNKDIEPEYGGLYTIPAYRVYNVGVSVLF